MILDELTVDRDAFAARTGWEVKPEGACKAEICVPLPDNVAAANNALDVEVLAARLGMPLVADDAHGIWALGPRAGGNCLDSAELPPIVLDDFDGRSFDLASLRGRKMLLTTWSSW